MPRAQERVEAWVNEESPEHRADLAASFAAGSRLGGYRLEEQVGAGGMAVVFRARDVRLDRLVALKIMTPAMGSDDMFRQRFIRESRAAAAVDDPHIIPVYEAGEAGHVLFIAMRLVRGGDVRSLLRREGPLLPDRVASIASPVASALDAAHAAGLVHRDVKPANILLDRRPGRPDHVYLSDFGLSKSAEVSLGLTAAGQFLGTPDYTAPEQIEGLPVDGRTDQYALACAVFELLTGQAPFHRNESFAAIWAHLNKPPPSLVERRPELPPAVDPVMAKALAKAQVDRYPTCWEFADALREALGMTSYHLGPASDPGLSRSGSMLSRDTLRRAAVSPAAAPPQGPAADGAAPPPGQDTDASAVYVARPPTADGHSGQAAPELPGSIPDEQPTDPGRPVSPVSPAEWPPSVQEKEAHASRQKASPPALPAGEAPSEADVLPRKAGAPPKQGDDLPKQGGTPPRQAGSPQKQAGLSRPQPGPSRPQPGPSRPQPGPSRPRPGSLGNPVHGAPRERLPGRRRVTYLTLIGAGVLAAVGVAVVLTMVLTTILVPARERPIKQSSFELPQVSGILSSVAFSPDGKTLAAGASGGLKAGAGGNGSTYRWSVANHWKPLPTFSPGGGAEAFSPDGTMLATVGGPDNSATYLWDVANRTQIAILDDRHHSPVDGVAFSPDGQLFAANDRNGTVYLWAVPRGRSSAPASSPGTISLPGAPNATAVAFNPQADTLAIGGSDGQAYLWDETQGIYRTLTIPGSASSQVTAVAFSPDGSMLAASETDGVTYLWDLAHHGRRIAFSAPDGTGVESLEFSPNGEWLATGDSNGKTYLWSPSTKKTKPAVTLTNPGGGAPGSLSQELRSAVLSVAFSPNSKTLATTDPNGHVYLWKMH